MKVTSISYTRVLSDRFYGNHQATVHADLEDGEPVSVALARARKLCEDAVGQMPSQPWTPRLREWKEQNTVKAEAPF